MKTRRDYDTKRLGEEKVSKLLLKFSIPAVVGMLVNALYNVVDRIFIGKGVGEEALTALGIAFPIMLIAMGFSMLIGFGSNSLLSIRLGEGKKEEGEQIIGQGLTLFIIVAILFSTLGIVFVKPLLYLFAADNETFPLARDYITIIFLGNIFMSIGFGMNNYIRAQGKPMIAMLTMLIGAISNIILDYIFIMVLNLGIKGAALATISAQFISASWVLFFFFSGRSILKIHFKNLYLKSKLVLKILALGLAPFSLQIAASVMQIILNNSLRVYGDASNIGGNTAIAGLVIVQSVSMILFMPIFGINQGAQPIIGYNYGAKKYDRVKKTLMLAIIAATTILTVGYIATRLFPEAFIKMFMSEEKLTDELLQFGKRAITIFMLLLPIVGVQILGSNYFQAIGKPLFAALLSLSRQVLLLIPLIIFLPKIYGLNGILYAAPISDSISFLLTVTVLSIELKRLKKIPNN